MFSNWTTALKGHRYIEGRVTEGKVFTPYDLIAALGSGKYKKGEGTLRSSDNRYCCLGVAADLCGIPPSVLVNRSMPGNLPYPRLAHFKGSWPWLFEGSDRLSVLARVNDRSATFQPVINKLRSYK